MEKLQLISRINYLNEILYNKEYELNELIKYENIDSNNEKINELKSQIGQIKLEREKLINKYKYIIDRENNKKNARNTVINCFGIIPDEFTLNEGVVSLKPKKSYPVVSRKTQKELEEDRIRILKNINHLRKVGDISKDKADALIEQINIIYGFDSHRVKDEKKDNLMYREEKVIYR